jgi:hypothetical protein
MTPPQPGGPGSLPYSYPQELDGPVTPELCELCPVKQGERRESGVVVRDTTFREGCQETISPVPKVPRQCPLVLLKEVMHMIGINSNTFSSYLLGTDNTEYIDPLFRVAVFT